MKTTTGKTTVGILGIGKISGIYLKNINELFHDTLELAACADLIAERAEAAAEEWKIPRALSPAGLLADPEIDIILNLTVPAVHYQTSLDIVRAGKHLYVEKPLCLNRRDGASLLKAATDNGVRVGCAPDTFLGAGVQSCRKIIDEGQIGRPIAATAFMTCHGHESWHPSPDFYYKDGGGPLFDMGPYYLTALAELMGPAVSVSGQARRSFAQRTISSQPRSGEIIDVDVPTHITGLLDFRNGAAATLLTSFDVWAAHLPFIEIYGSEGSLSVPDPNSFGGPVLLKRPGDNEWQEMPLLPDYRENSRALGLADMAAAIRDNRPHRASGERALHVLDIMQSILESAESGSRIRLIQ